MLIGYSIIAVLTGIIAVEINDAVKSPQLKNNYADHVIKGKRTRRQNSAKNAGGAGIKKAGGVPALLISLRVDN
ncbi:hypothetical protein [Prolixibacter sp. SD074]|jgi:hypothetical protein|uniref:hypothetical protein n=1 Tax=Prolixibacter sp. SD074 TaxID=2652391 RepID=UPI00127E7DA7|nr:hypothetical protein [Prolixibacter sp. SD074]GET30309.1 hypothetical protein SD074_25110 [Prolixibacter sp. SD074]